MTRQVRYQQSKIFYAVLLNVSVIVDLVLALTAYRILEAWFGSGLLLAALVFLLVCILGTVLYLLHMWQMEYLTKEK